MEVLYQIYHDNFKKQYSIFKYTNIYHFLSSFTSIHKPFGNNSWAKNFISLSEFLEKDSVREPLPTNTDSFQYTITSQLIKYQMIINLSSTFVVIWNDTSNKVWFGTVQCTHKASQLFLESENVIGLKLK